MQHGAAIFALSASFQREEEGLEHADVMPEVPGPETVPPFRERAARFIDRVPENRREWLERDRPIDTRPLDGTDFFTRGVREPSSRIWIRADGKLPDDPALHQCVAAYASDLTLLDTAARPHGISFLDDDVQVASLDHAMWFHRPFRADEWLLYDQESPSMARARAFTRARLFSQDGRLVASVAQEGLLRTRR